jgi:prophage regulatory protein
LNSLKNFDHHVGVTIGIFRRHSTPPSANTGNFLGLAGRKSNVDKAYLGAVRSRRSTDICLSKRMPINASFSYFDRSSAPQKQAEQCSIMTSKLASVPVSLDDEEQERLQPQRPDFRRWVRRPELRRIVPLGDTTIYELEQKGEFPKRFNLTPRCVVWDLAEVEAWVEARRMAFETGTVRSAPGPDVRQRKARPVK